MSIKYENIKKKEIVEEVQIYEADKIHTYQTTINEPRLLEERKDLERELVEIQKRADQDKVRTNDRIKEIDFLLLEIEKIKK